MRRTEKDWDSYSESSGGDVGRERDMVSFGRTGASEARGGGETDLEGEGGESCIGEDADSSRAFDDSLSLAGGC